MVSIWSVSFEMPQMLSTKLPKVPNPLSLPILQSSRFHLAINLKSATALGITLPVAFTARADEVLE
jgi:putative ABC transport system substrate-binding protein